mmetsp:Transcript_11041/g.31999  ORF Transcript_11041/g.31999 Transcript_11041/m.31999 type:complete len:87 (+) Transcript_11041:2653-2913(+)
MHKTQNKYEVISFHNETRVYRYKGNNECFHSFLKQVCLPSALRSQCSISLIYSVSSKFGATKNSVVNDRQDCATVHQTKEQAVEYY